MDLHPSNDKPAGATASALPPIADCGASILLPDDLAALKRFAECCEDSDSGGHNVSRAKMSRLTEIGVARHLGFGNHQVTSFGDYVLGIACGEVRALPLKTYQEYCADAAAAREAQP